MWCLESYSEGQSLPKVQSNHRTVMSKGTRPGTIEIRRGWEEYFTWFQSAVPLKRVAQGRFEWGLESRLREGSIRVRGEVTGVGFTKGGDNCEQYPRHFSNRRVRPPTLGRLLPLVRKTL